MFDKKIIIPFLFIAFFSCTDALKTESKTFHSENKVDTISIQELTDVEYPDNPDIGYRHSRYGAFSHKELLLIDLGSGAYRFEFLPSNGLSDSIVFPRINLKNFMPAVPQKIVDTDDYLTKIAIINQEWNRHQVRFDASDGLFSVKAKDSSRFEYRITRIDLARNCLSSGLWEIIAYAEENGKSVPFYHGWFDFPLAKYKKEFSRVNPSINFDDYSEHLVTWKDPEMEEINRSMLSTKGKEIEISYKNLNHSLYPETGARASKKKNVVYPPSFANIQDLLNDRTMYSTFSPPGIYRTDDPRKTTLGKMDSLLGIKVFHSKSTWVEGDKSYLEIELEFLDKQKENKTKLIFGGIDTSKFPVLDLSENQKGYKYPMGIANHSFYENYNEANVNEVSKNPYFGIILNEKNEWLDSHFFGIDGPLFFWDKEHPTLLHLFILSFERHTYVGHYILKFES